MIALIDLILFRDFIRSLLLQLVTSPLPQLHFLRTEEILTGHNWCTCPLLLMGHLADMKKETSFTLSHVSPCGESQPNNYTRKNTPPFSHHYYIYPFLTLSICSLVGEPGGTQWDFYCFVLAVNNFLLWLRMTPWEPQDGSQTMPLQSKNQHKTLRDAIKLHDAQIYSI